MEIVIGAVASVMAGAFQLSLTIYKSWEISSVLNNNTTTAELFNLNY
jgi:hypothetical protein